MFNKSKAALAVVSAISFFSSSIAIAQTSDDLERITVTANRITQSISDTLELRQSFIGRTKDRKIKNL